MIHQREAAHELLRRRKAREGLVDYARYIDVPGAPLTDDPDAEEFAPIETQLAAHHEIILKATQRCIERYSGRTMLFLPPGSAKSTYATVVAPTWAMGKVPEFKVIGASYGSDLARKFGRRMRSIVKQRKFEALFSTALSAESSAANEWALTNGSEYMGGGILSGITGNRADFVPIDDPIKGRQEADSEVTRKRTIEAYQDDILTRLKPGGSVMITQTRWHEGDLAGSLLPEGWDGQSGMIECTDGETWEVICIPAQCVSANDPLGRKIGEYIWPEWFDEGHWQKFKRVPRTWSALFQQRPQPDEGTFFQRDWFKEWEALPTLRYYGTSDYAVTDGGGDWTVHTVWGVDASGAVYRVDQWKGQTTSDVWIEQKLDLIKRYKPLAWFGEGGVIQKAIEPMLRRRMRERGVFCRLEWLPSVADKPTRARSFQAMLASGRVYFERGADLSEFLVFPAGKHDDEVDTASLIGRAIDQAHPAIVSGKTDSRPKDRWDKRFAREDEEAASWKIA
ncbi:terminase large subunit [Pseudanabaena phage Pan3]|nr:terminase large subunit [Pseudanabaena phage Pan3]